MSLSRHHKRSSIHGDRKGGQDRDSAIEPEKRDIIGSGGRDAVGKREECGDCYERSGDERALYGSENVLCEGSAQLECPRKQCR